MKPDRTKLGSRAALLFVAFLLAIPWGDATAGLIASDSYVIGSDPTSGQYTSALALKSQPAELSNLGFGSGGYTHGTTINGQVSSQFVAATGSLVYAPLGVDNASSGKVTYQAAPVDGNIRTVARNLNAVPTSGTYFISELVRQDGTAGANGNGFILSGFGNTVAPTLTGQTSPLAGLYFGFSQHGVAGDSGDLVIRYRDTTGNTAADRILVDGSSTSTANQTYEILAEVDVNVGGTPVDHVTYWVNPTNFSSTSALTSSSLLSGGFDSYALQGAGDFVRLNYSSLNWNGNAFFDEAKLATTLADIAPPASGVVPAPASLLLLGMNAIGGLAAGLRRWARS